ncbi:HAD-IC family P-type ATPase [uncultured Thiodictyon sp.]|uniref:HAD-IC family P-type ATPase n=1 Tax=uncultured Thiodictyon sp. TaxID=1846217 RepID=UPI0025FEA46E|nr:HAD-IC family P-type ATPase [uncultured Thiodictyon sp.]
MDAAAVLDRLASTPNGLEPAPALERLRRCGPNRLTERKGRGPLVRLLLQFHNVLIYTLLAAAAVTAALGHWVDTGVIVGVVVINAIIGFIQEGKAEQALAAIRRMLSLKATVVRAGHQSVIAAEALVPGDVVLIQSGDRVPADLRLLRVKNLRIEEASLTGESMPVEKQTQPVAPAASLGDRTCMAYSGTLVAFGQAHGLVVATGDATELGRISRLIGEVQRLETPLLRKMAVFSRWLSLAIGLVAAAAFALGALLWAQPVADMFMAAVGIAVAAIPEGLPAIITIALAIGVQRMAQRHAIVRVLPAVEALGSVTVICSDKTGTLTRNEMTVQSVITAGQIVAVGGAGYAPHGEFCHHDTPIDPLAEGDLLELLRAGLLCNDAQLQRDEEQWHIVGDPTEGALTVLAAKAGLDLPSECGMRPRTDVIPFESEHRFMATLHHDHAGHGFVYLKGAPEQVMAMCTWERHAGEDRPLAHAAWEVHIEALAGRGQRVLACAFQAATADRRDLAFADVASGLTLLGLFGIMDPPREEAIRAVAACRAAGIRVKMITGDHRATAAAIAAQLGIGAAGGGGAAMTGTEIESLSDAQLSARVGGVDIYARVSPEHKLRLVQALQAAGEVVAMTGDGVNDAPALKRADIGVAMGMTGTEAAKEAAEIVLADDNFASIASAVEEGRTVYDNLRKTLLFILPTNGGEAGTLLMAIGFGLVLPILPVQILWVNMITAVTLALTLAFEPAENQVMRRPPRNPRAPIFSGYFLWRTLLVSLILVAGTLGIFLWELAQGTSLDVARTAAVNTLVLFEAFYLLNCRFLIAPAWHPRTLLGNPYVLPAILLVIGFQLLYTYAPFMQTWFQSAALAGDTWLRIVAITLSGYVIIELEKGLVRWLKLPID